MPRFTCAGLRRSSRPLLMRSLTRQVRRLARGLKAEPDAKARLLAAIAIARASVGLQGLEGLMRAAFQALENELDQQVLSDGGHRSRNPADIAALMVELIPVRMALEAARLEIPSRFNAAIERMLPALRFFSHGDGGLASFNGLRDGMVGWARAVLETDNVRGKPLTHAVHSGYCRLQAGQAVVIADTGRYAASRRQPAGRSRSAVDRILRRRPSHCCQLRRALRAQCRMGHGGKAHCGALNCLSRRRTRRPDTRRAPLVRCLRWPGRARPRRHRGQRHLQ